MTFSLSTGHNPYLVILSVVIAGLASYTTLDLVRHVKVTAGHARIGWLISGAIAMGTGIWAMHFIGMLAFRLPIYITYSVEWVIISVIPAILASALALSLVSRLVVEWLQLLGASLCLGLGIATMHYLGMMAMCMAATVHYDWTIVALSVVIAIAVSAIGLFLAIRFRETSATPPFGQKLLAATIMGAAIPTMHYTGMAAAQFTMVGDTPPPLLLQPTANFAVISAAISIGSIIILGFTLLAVFVDRRMTAQAARTQAALDSHTYLQAILQGIQVGVVVVDANSTIQMSNQAILDLLHLDDSTALQNLWSEAQKQSQSKNSFLSLDSAKDGSGDSAKDGSRDSAKDGSKDSPAAKRDTAPRRRSLLPVLGAIASQQSVQNAVVCVQPTPDATTYLLVNAVPLSPCAPNLSPSNLSPSNLSPPNLSPSNLLDRQIVCTFSEITELKQAETLLKQSTARFRTLAQQEEILNRLSTQIRQSLDLQTILQTAVCEVRQAFRSDRALIYHFKLDRHGQVMVEDRGEQWGATLGTRKDDCFPDRCLAHYNDGNVKAINNTLTAGLHPDHLSFLQSLQIQASLIAPIRFSHQLWGLLIVHQCDHPRVWQSSEEKLLSRLGTQVGIAIQQAELYTKSEQSAQRAQAQAQQLQQSETQLRQKTQTLEDTLQELREMQLQLVHNEKMSALGQLIAGVAHEINNPLNFIVGNLNYTRDSVEDLLNLVQEYQQYYPNPHPTVQALIDQVDLPFLQDDLPKSLQSMRIGTNRIRQIVKSLHIFSRTDEAEIKAVDIHEGLDSSLLILQHRLKQQTHSREIEVIRLYGEIPFVKCYPGPLNQVFMNVLVNAIDALDEKYEMTSHHPSFYSPSPSQLTIRTAMFERFDGGQMVEIAIADNGLGIPPQIQQRIFDPFFTTKPVGKGTGLGMSISHQIITEKHKGHIKCHSTPGQGTEFIIQIPVHAPVGDDGGMEKHP